MKYDRLKRAAEHIKMPDSLRESILDKCDDISAASKNNTPADNEQVFTVERVKSHPIRRTLAAVAACAVVVGGLGYTAHLAVRRSGADPATDMSEMQANPILEALDDLLSREFNVIQKVPIDESIAEDMSDPSTTGAKKSIIPSEEQRKAIIDIISEYEWTEITDEEYIANNDTRRFLLLLEAFESLQTVDDQYAGIFWDLVINADGFVEFCCEEQLETGTFSSTFYRVENSEELAERILNVFASEAETEEVTEAPTDLETDFCTLADFENTMYKEMGYSSATLSQEQRSAIAELFRGLDFEPSPANKVYQSPAYYFSAGNKLIYFYYYGTVEVRSGDNTQFFETDFEAVDSGLNSILYDGQVIKGSDLLCDNFLNKNVRIHSLKSYEDLSISPESIAAVAEVLAETTFRPVEDTNDYISEPESDFYNKKTGFEYIEIRDVTDLNKGWTMDIFDYGRVDIYVFDEDNLMRTRYLTNTTELYINLCGAIPELAGTDSAPFGYIYKRGDVTVNGELLTEENAKAVSNLFVGFKWDNEQTADDFPEKDLKYTIEADNLTVKVYENGTVAYSHATDKAGDADGRVHIYPGLTKPETMAEPLVIHEIEFYLNEQRMN